MVGPILLTDEESQEGPALQSDVISNRSAQHWIFGLKGIQDRTDSRRSPNLYTDLARDVREGPQVRGNHKLNHGSVCTSTDSTAGRFSTMDAQLFPESGETYTCPPVVPK